jgi:hypothetical protein
VYGLSDLQGLAPVYGPLACPIGVTSRKMKLSTLNNTKQRTRNKQMIKTYSIAMMKQHGLELVKGLPVMTLSQAEKALQLSLDAGLQGFCVVNVNAQ